MNKPALVGDRPIAYLNHLNIIEEYDWRVGLESTIVGAC